MQEGRRAGARLVCTAALSSTAATGAFTVQGIALQGLPFAPLRLLSDAASQLSAACSAHAAHEQSRQRRLSHYAATTSSGGSQPCSSSSVGRRSGRGERSFASQPAAAYEQALVEGGATGAGAAPLRRQPPPPPSSPLARERSDLLERAHLAAATLKARAMERMEAVKRIDATKATAGVSQLGFRERVGLPPAMPKPQGRQRLTRVKQEQEETDVSVWERLGPMFTAGRSTQPTPASIAALSIYRQEVLRGQDPDAAADGCAHVPFLRCGMYAAQQGYALSSSPARHGLLSAMLAPEEAPLSARTQGVLQGLREAMDASRSAAGGRAGVQSDASAALPVGRAALESLLPATEPAPLAALEAAAEGSEGAAAAAAEEEEEEPVDMTLAELAEWERQRAERGAAARAASRRSRPRRPLAAAAVPTAAADHVLRALGEVPEVEVGQLRAAVHSLYKPSRRAARKDARPLTPLVPPADPAACLARVKRNAEVLVQDLGAGQFEALVAEAPWVLLLDPETQGRPQLGCLHAADMGRRERAKLLRGYPRLLTLDAEAHLLPVLEYLQSLGMSSKQMAQCIKKNPRLCEPNSLPALQAVAAFWLGKGMAKADFIHMLAQFPRAPSYNLNVWHLKYEWLAAHVGFTLRDVSFMPWFVAREMASMGPRIALALSRGVKFTRPSSNVALGPGGGRRRFGCVSLGRFLCTREEQTCRKLGVSEEEFESFKQRWLAEELPAWLAARNASIEQYRVLTGSRKCPTHRALAAGAPAATDASLDPHAASAHERQLEDGFMSSGQVEEGEGEESEEELLAAVA